MFTKKTYSERRKILKRRVGSGLILFLGNDESPMNYAANTYPFRQDSTFLYYFGLNMPGLAAVIDVDADRDLLFGNDAELSDIIWVGPQPLLSERGRTCGVRETFPFDRLAEVLQEAVQAQRRIHFLPPYRGEQSILIEKLLGIQHAALPHYISPKLVQAVVDQRSLKSREEIAEIESALAVTRKMHLQAQEMVRPGLYEREVVAAMEQIATAAGYPFAFPPIVSKNCETFHNPYHHNRLNKGEMLLVDAGCETPSGYASDITRTIPVSGAFSTRQREIYEVVLSAQLAAIAALKPGIPFRQVHLRAARTIAAGLKELGLMRGDTAEAVRQGAHALFFPHGLGHLMGLDVHDMENLGENYVGYSEKFKRSSQFGFAYLRFAKELRPGLVITIEPGIYFVPALIKRWQAEKKLTSYIDYARVNRYLNFHGIRIEDNVLITRGGHRVLGKPIPKTPDELAR